MVLLDLNITPLGKGESVSSYVSRSVQIIAESGLDYRLHAMGTIVEGELPDVLAVMQRCLDAMVADCDRVTCTAKLDYRKGYQGRLESKVASVEGKLGRDVNKA